MTLSAPVVDADGHVLEPADTWLKYLESSYRDRAIRIGRDEHGYEVLLIGKGKALEGEANFEAAAEAVEPAWDSAIRRYGRR